MGAPKTDLAGVRQVIRAMHNIGAKPFKLDNLGEITIVRSMGEKYLLGIMQQTDEDMLSFEKGDLKLTVDFVYGNAPYEVVSDYWPADDNELTHALDALIDTWDD